MSKEKPQATKLPLMDEEQSPGADDPHGAMITGWTGMVKSMKNTIDYLAKKEPPIELMGRKLSVPNLLSILRLVFIPVLLFAAWSDNHLMFQILLGIVLLMALADGILARRLGQVTDLGAELDSWGVFVVFITVPLCAWSLWPDIVRRESAFIIALVVFHVVPASLGLLKYGRLTSYHTWGFKLSAVMLSFGVFILMVGGPAWPFRIVVPIMIVAGIEVIFMTGILRLWQTNIPSLWHALRIEQTKVEKALQEREKRSRDIRLNI